MHVCNTFMEIVVTTGINVSLDTSSPKLYCLALSIPTRVEYMVVFSVKKVALNVIEREDVEMRVR